MAGEVRKQQFAEGTVVGTPTDIATSPVATASVTGTITTYVPVIKSSTKETSIDYIILDDDGFDKILVTTGASNPSIRLPTEVDNAGREIFIKKVDSGAGNTVIRDDAVAIITELGTEDTYIKFLCNGTIWEMMDTNDFVNDFSDTGNTVSNTTDVNIGSVNLEKGVWHVSATFYFNAAVAGTAGTDFGRGFFGTAATSTAGNLGTDATEGAMNSSRGCAHIDRVFTVATAATYNTNAQISAGASAIHNIRASVTVKRLDI